MRNKLPCPSPKNGLQDKRYSKSEAFDGPFARSLQDWVCGEQMHPEQLQPACYSLVPKVPPLLPHWLSTMGCTVFQNITYVLLPPIGLFKEAQYLYLSPPPFALSPCVECILQFPLQIRPAPSRSSPICQGAVSLSHSSIKCF